MGRQTQRAAGNSRTLRHDRHKAARRAAVRVSAQTGSNARQNDDHSLGRLPVQQSRAEYGHANGQPRGGAADEPRGDALPGAGLDRCQAARAERPGLAALRRAEHAKPVARRVCRRSGKTV